MEVADIGAAERNPPIVTALCSPTLTLIFSIPLVIHNILDSRVNFTPVAMANTQLLTCTSPVSLFLPPNQPLPMLILFNRKISLKELRGNL